MKLNYKSGALYANLGVKKREYFYEDGTLKTLETYLDGKLDGEICLYWPNGKLKRKCQFQKGVRHGLDQMWSEEGKLLDEGNYSQGKPVGKHCRWTSQGQLLEEIEYLEPSRFNIRQWDEKGNLRMDAGWEDLLYHEKVWDRFQNIWIEKEGRWDGKKLVYV